MNESYQTKKLVKLTNKNLVRQKLLILPNKYLNINIFVLIQLLRNLKYREKNGYFN